MVHIHLNPLDTLFFRDSRPFAAGEEGFAQGSLPSPLSIYGAIGSYYLDAKGISLADFKKNGDAKLGTFDDALSKDDGMRIKGPFLRKDGTPYFVSPANLWLLKGTTQIYPLLPKESCPEEKRDLADAIAPLRSDTDYHLEPSEYLLDIDEIKSFLTGEIDAIFLALKETDLWDSEMRTGHQISEETKTVTDGMLYASQHLRLKETMPAGQGTVKRTSLLVVTEQLEAKDFTLPSYCMGGERRSLKVAVEEPSEQLFPPLEDDVVKKIKKEKKFFLYLATPALFEAGWKPKPISNATLISAAVGKPRYISGWQSLANRPRPLLKMVPAGAVYFYRIDSTSDAEIDQLIAGYHFNQSISDHYPNAGFGTTLIGSW